MIKINMQMPDCCMKCAFYRGSSSGGFCSADEWNELNFCEIWAAMDRHPKCPLQEVD